MLGAGGLGVPLNDNRSTMATIATQSAHGHEGNPTARALRAMD